MQAVAEMMTLCRPKRSDPLPCVPKCEWPFSRPWMLAARSMLFFSAVLLTAAGCRGPGPYVQNPALSKGADPLEFGADDGTKKTESKGQPAASAEKHLPDGSPPDQEELLEVIRQIDEMGDLDPKVRDQLMADLRETKPSLWPAMVQQFRSAVAFRRQLEARDASSSASKSVVSRDEAIERAFAVTGAADAGRAARSRRVATEDRPLGRRDSRGESGPLPPIPDAVAPQSSGDRASNAGQVPQLSAVRLKEEPRAPAPLRGAVRRGQTTGGESGPRPRIESPDRADRPANAISKIEQAPDGRGDPVRMAVATEDQLGESEGVDRTSLVDRQPGVLATEASRIPVSISEPGELAAMIQNLERQNALPPRTTEEVSRHAALRMLYLAAGRREDALKPIQGISPAQQDFWLQQLYGLATYLDSQQQPNATLRAVAAKRHLREAERKLGELGTLSVQNMAFCTEVSSFGVYKEFKTREFTSGQAVLLYAEVENFKSEQTEEGFRTALQSSYQILDSEGKQIGEHEYSLTEDLCKNHRRDFFMRYFLRLPEPIGSGTYTLELTIEDTLANKIGQSSISFEIREKK
ncbi:MAG: hypothetical protein ACC645_04015 [Pirellulales bacterium]